MFITLSASSFGFICHKIHNVYRCWIQSKKTVVMHHNMIV